MRAFEQLAVAGGLIALVFAVGGAQCVPQNGTVIEVVTLSHAIFTADGPDFLPGDVFPLDRISGGIVFAPDSSCAVDHLHADNLVGIFINGIGPYPDPDPFGCGYGPVAFELFP